MLTQKYIFVKSLPIKYNLIRRRNTLWQESKDIVGHIY